MKPTKEIIKLSKKLKELGYKQTTVRGDWLIIHYKNGNERIDLHLDKYPSTPSSISTPIPSLEDGLEWLKKKGFVNLCVIQM